MENKKPQLMIITGLSGGGKSSALDALEDLGFYCVDNLPGPLLEGMVQEVQNQPERYQRVAIGVDVRIGEQGLNEVTTTLDQLATDLQVMLVFIEANNDVLMRRFSETRRRHPLIGESGLGQAIELERKLLNPIRERAEHILDSSENNIHQLRHKIWRLAGSDLDSKIQTIVIESFAFKRGVPREIDFLFDARGLPNPHWDKALRPFDGRDEAVIDWLESHAEVNEFKQDILSFLNRWIPSLAEGQRSLLTVAIGCTGGQHRSVYLAESIAQALSAKDLSVRTFHRELV